VDPETKRRLVLAVHARDFGVRVLGLRGDGNFSRFLDTHHQPVAYMVSAAPKDRLVPHLFRFPFVGALPYVGFFREEDARAEAERLGRLGLDTYIRPVAGYSTVGLTSDPIYSSMLEGSDARIVEVVLHEMAHGTVFLPGRGAWNEGFATLVGLEGAALFFASSERPDLLQELRAEAEARSDREAAFAAWVRATMTKLERLYAENIAREEKLRRREEVFAKAQGELCRLFPRRQGGHLCDEPLNNAVLLGHAVYHAETPGLRRLLARLGGNLPAFIRLVRHAAENYRDPVAWLQGL